MNKKKKLIKVIIELKNIFGENEDIDNPKDMAIAALIGGNFGGNYCCKFGYNEKDVDIIANFFDAFYKSNFYPNIDNFSFCKCGCRVNEQCIHILNSAQILKYIFTDFNYNLFDFVYGYDMYGNFNKLKVSLFNELINKNLSNLNYSYSPNNDDKIINDLNILLYALSQKEIIDNINNLSFDMIFDKYKNVDINKFFNDFKYFNFINDLDIDNDIISFSCEQTGMRMKYTPKKINLKNISYNGTKDDIQFNNLCNIINFDYIDGDNDNYDDDGESIYEDFENIEDYKDKIISDVDDELSDDAKKLLIYARLLKCANIAFKQLKF